MLFFAMALNLVVVNWVTVVLCLRACFARRRCSFAQVVSVSKLVFLAFCFLSGVVDCLAICFQ